MAFHCGRSRFRSLGLAEQGWTEANEIGSYINLHSLSRTRSVGGNGGHAAGRTACVSNRADHSDRGDWPPSCWRTLESTYSAEGKQRSNSASKRRSTRAGCTSAKYSRLTNIDHQIESQKWQDGFITTGSACVLPPKGRIMSQSQADGATSVRTILVRCRFQMTATDVLSSDEFCVFEFPGCEGCPNALHAVKTLGSSEDPMKSKVLSAWIAHISAI